MPEHQLPDADFLALQRALAGRYSIERELGRGGMGVVYLAQDVALDRPVALKLLPPALAAQPALRERFIQEARTAAKLSHPHIVPIHAVDQVDDLVFFVMSFVEGETLGARVRTRGPVAPREATRILREVGWALAYAHAQGVVHRDVKPDNILLEAGSGRALVTDFGIARAGAVAGLTGTAELLGTPEYMSPEQAGGDEVDGRSDLYALGVVAHFILSGMLPFQGATAHATLARQLTQPAPALASVAPEAPRSLAEAVDRCLEKDPAARFQGGEELADLLGRVLQDRKEVPAAIRVFQEQQRESQGALGVVGMLFVMMVAVVVVILDEAGMGELSDLLPGIMATLLWLVVPLGLIGGMVRRLLKAGYGHDELVRALRGDVEERRAELSVEADARMWLDIWPPRAALLGVVLFSLGAVGLPFPWFPIALVEVLMLAGTGIGAVGVLTMAIGAGLRQTAPGARWLAFWDSTIGKGIFGVAGIALRSGGGAGGSYRPTELAISMAAERLFDDLPKDVRRSVGDVPGVLKMLEGHAESMRGRLRGLDRLLGDVAPEAGLGGSAQATAREKRDAVAEEVRSTRAAVEERLREVVAALESLRLELLRLHGGAADVTSFTMDVAAARALAEDAGRLAEGHRQVNEMLGRPRTGEREDTPQPV